MITDKLHTPRGLTLIELMVAIAVIAVLAVLAVPNLNNFMRNNRLTSQINSFVSALQVARNEAVKRGAHVVLCASDNQTSCNTTQWELGWIIFVDGSNTFSTAAPGGRPSGTDQVLRVGSKLGGNDTLRSSFTNAGAIMYLPSGATSSTNASGTFTLCDPGDPSDTNNATDRQKRALAVNITTTGFISQATDTDGNGIVNDVTGSDVTCP